MLGQPFDPKGEFFNHDRLRPHWSQAGAIVFVTARTRDSIPREVLLRWEREKDAWLDNLDKRMGKTNWYRLCWKDRLSRLNASDRRAFQKHFSHQHELELDLCHGACWLRNPECAKIVADSLMYFDGIRYRIGDFVIMPNHFHALVVFGNPNDMEKQFASWLHWTAKQINRLRGVSGHFWQQEPFDHLVRNTDQYQYLRQYIADNPNKAGLRKGEFYYRRLAE